MCHVALTHDTFIKTFRSYHHRRRPRTRPHSTRGCFVTAPLSGWPRLSVKRAANHARPYIVEWIFSLRVCVCTVCCSKEPWWFNLSFIISKAQRAKEERINVDVRVTCGECSPRFYCVQFLFHATRFAASKSGLRKLDIYNSIVTHWDLPLFCCNVIFCFIFLNGHLWVTFAKDRRQIVKDNAKEKKFVNVVLWWWWWCGCRC